MSKGKQRDLGKERFWRRMIAQREKSGLSVQRFCTLHKLSAHRFYVWRRVIQERDGQKVDFVPVQVVSDEPAVETSNIPTSALELVLRDGRRLRVGVGFDAATLQRLLALLEEGRTC